MPCHSNVLQLLEQFAQKFVYNLLKQKRERSNNGIFFGLGCFLSVPQESHLRMKNQYNCFKLSKRFSYSGPFFSQNSGLLELLLLYLTFDYECNPSESKSRKISRKLKYYGSSSWKFLLLFQYFIEKEVGTNLGSSKNRSCK